MKKVAILTPSYNRANLLPRLYESLLTQSSDDFVWYIVDDGSGDNTEDVVQGFIDKSTKTKGFKIVYIKKENGGKHTALNVGIAQIDEPFTAIVDSDDYLKPNAIETIVSDSKNIQSDNYCGMAYLKECVDGKVTGKVYADDIVEDTFINQRYNKNTYGDKFEVFKTEILKKFPFPVFEGEKFVSESTVWCKMSGEYKMIFFNKSLYVCEYQEGGLSDGVKKRLFNNPKGSVACYKELSTKDFKLKLRIKYTIAYIVYALADKMTLKEMKKNHPQNKFLITLLYLPSLMYFKKLQRKFR